MASQNTKDKRLREIVEKSQYWDVEDLIRNFDKEMARLEQGLAHMVWDHESRCVTTPLRPLPVTPTFKVDETENEFKIKARLPNVSKEDLRLSVDGKSVSVFACSGDAVCRPYFLRVDADGELVPDSADATMSGESLEVRVAKAKKKRVKIK
jgi:HSP20 family molecular chaperone IbpA